MVCLETKEEANTAIQDLNETTRYIAKEYEPKKQRINIEKNWKNSHQYSERTKDQTTEHSRHWTHSPNNTINKYVRTK